MSSSETDQMLETQKISVPNRRGFLLLSAVSISALAGGCFRPLYGDVASNIPGGGRVRDTLRAIEVTEIPDLVGHYLRNELVFELDGSGEETAKRYKLSVNPKETVDVTVVDVTTGRADSATLTLNATWRLTSIPDGKVVTSGENFIRVTYDRSSQRFATVRAARDARIRGAKGLAGIIRNSLAAALVSGT